MRIFLWLLSPRKHTIAFGGCLQIEHPLGLPLDHHEGGLVVELAEGRPRVELILQMMMVVLLKVGEQVVLPLPCQRLMDQEGHMGLPFFNWGNHILSLGVEAEGQVLLFVLMVIIGLGEEACPTSTVVACKLGFVPRWCLEMVGIEVF